MTTWRAPVRNAFWAPVRGVVNYVVSTGVAAAAAAAAVWHA